MITHLKRLPSELVVHILELLSIDDCVALEEADKALFDCIYLKDNFWSRKLFEKHIQYPGKTVNIFKLSNRKIPYYIPSPIEFDNFTDAKSLWLNLMSIQHYLGQFLEGHLGFGNEQASAFGNRIYSILSNPPEPISFLRHETQYLPTSSSFENFLTELFFGVCYQPRLYDREYQFIYNVCKGIIMDEIEQNIKQEKGLIILLGIQELVRTHCQIISKLLFSLTNEKTFLKEYNRCWKEFTYSIIEITAILKPFEDFIRNILSQGTEFCQEVFSVWKLMVAIWVEEVYNNLSAKILSSFSGIFMCTILQTISNKNLSNDKKSFIYETLGLQYNEYHELESVQKTRKLLMKVFITLSDISLSRVDSVIFDNISLDSLTPKVELIKVISSGLQKLLGAAFVVIERENAHLNEILADIQSLFNLTFNEEMFLDKSIPNYIFQERNCDLNDVENYRIISKCKWANRLSPVYQSLNVL